VEKLDFMPKLFNPEGRCCRRKMLPTAGACIEQNRGGRRCERLCRKPGMRSMPSRNRPAG
jgi:hypothetical protein